MSRLIIIGAGGHGRVTADCAQAINYYQDIVFLDDGFPSRKNNAQWPIIDTASNWNKYIGEGDFFVSFGDNKLRKSFLNQLIDAKEKIPTLIHPKSVVTKHSTIGYGVIVLANAVINYASTIGNGCIINTAATIDHDCNIDDFVHISPGANIAGDVKVKTLSWLGIGCSIIECITIAPNTVIGAGAAVVSPTEPDSLYVGVPARKIKTLE